MAGSSSGPERRGDGLAVDASLGDHDETAQPRLAHAPWPIEVAAEALPTPCTSIRIGLPATSIKPLTRRMSCARVAAIESVDERVGIVDRREL